MRHIRVYCLQSGSEITSALSKAKAIRHNLRIFTRIFSALNRQKNKNNQPGPEKHNTLKGKKSVTALQSSDPK